VKVTEELEFRRMCCSECTLVYFFPEAWCEGARQAGRSWKCPNGHGQWFGEAEAVGLRRERDRLKQQVARAEEERDAALRREAEARNHATMARAREVGERNRRRRVEVRVHAGVCPDCSRTFANVARHMRTQHGTPSERAAAVEVARKAKLHAEAV